MDEVEEYLDESSLVLRSGGGGRGTIRDCCLELPVGTKVVEEAVEEASDDSDMLLPRCTMVDTWPVLTL